MNHPQFDCDLIAAEKEKLIEQQAERIKELESLSVTNIMVAVVPGEDGMGEEVYAKSVAEVESLLTSLSEKAEDATDKLAALRQRIADAPVVGWRWVEADMSKKFAVYEFGIPYSYKHVAKPLISKEDLK